VGIIIVLELFAGTGGISEAFRQHGHECLTIDNNPALNPNLCIDILSLDPKNLPASFHAPDIIWASPPCQCFSVLTISRHWKNGKPISPAVDAAIKLVKKTLELISFLDPKYFFIENPMGMLRKQDFMQRLPRKTVTYCQYGASYRKATDIWTNCSSWLPKPSCKNGAPCHIPAPRSSNSGIQALSGAKERSEIPHDLCNEIVLACEGRLKEIQEVLLCH